jgi:hypothetical protein
LDIDHNNISESLKTKLLNDVITRPRRAAISKQKSQQNDKKELPTKRPIHSLPSQMENVDPFQSSLQTINREQTIHMDEKYDEKEKEKDEIGTREEARRRELCEKGKKTGLGIDGGGMRGLIPAMILQSLEEICKPLRVYELFDVIGGTSIGGILALSCTASLNDMHPILDTHAMVNFFHQYSQTIFPKHTGITQVWSAVKQLWSVQYVIFPFSFHTVILMNTE